jgi:hypothetical protein
MFAGSLFGVYLAAALARRAVVALPFLRQTTMRALLYNPTLTLIVRKPLAGLVFFLTGFVVGALVRNL